IPQERDKRIGVVALGCTSRSLAVLLQEKQIARDLLHIIGVACPGMLDVKKLEDMVNLRKVEAIREDGDEIIVEPQGLRLNRRELLFDSCQLCPYPTPVLYDEIIGERREGVGGFPDVEEMEKLSPQEREDYLNERFALCIRCFACRLTCPSCYCKECFAESLLPRFVSHQVTMEDSRVFHLNRAMHLAGRCVSCGECLRACPLGVPMFILHRKMEKSAFELFQYTSGLDPSQPPLLNTYSPNDPDPEGE
ncbi:MAG: 4Fe-4S dicluster domain-containing protein, partial [Chloroflexi bacterium]|nr:4Fe-4S dicluster domain-containing protein [Chloroflexota bacterium]